MAIGNLISNCGGLSGTCAGFTSTTVDNADGSITTIDAWCLSGGLKIVKTNTDIPTDGGVHHSNTTFQHFINGTICYSEEDTGVATYAGTDTSVTTEVYKDDSGAAVGTVVFTTVLNGATVTQTQTIFCDGQTSNNQATCLASANVKPGAPSDSSGCPGECM